MSIRLPLCASIGVDDQYDFQEFRTKMSDQLKCLGDRTDVQMSSLSELQDYFRKRGEIESEYACKLEKLSKSIAQKHKSERSRREGWPQHTSSTVWHTLVEQTKEEYKKRQSLGELYGKQMTASIETRCEDLAKISKRCREIGSYSHNELNRVLTELQTAMKTYQLCYAEMCGIERKKRSAEEDVKRYEDSNPGKYEGSRRHRSLVKYFKRREEKFEVVRLKCTKARNEYLLCVKAANAALHRFFAQDLSYLIDCMDLGMDFWLRALLEKVIDERKKITQHEMDSLASLSTLRSSVDVKADKQKFFEANHQLFMLPKQFEFRPQLGDDIMEVSAEQSLSSDLLQRQLQIEKRLEGLQFEVDEVWKSLEASEKQLLQLYNTQFDGEAGKWRNDLHVTYQYYLKKFEHFLLNGNLMERLEARSASIGEALGKHGISLKSASVGSASERNGSFTTENGGSQNHHLLEERRSKARRIGGIVTKSPDDRPRPKLFGGSLDEYVEATGEEIPLLVQSAIAYLSRYSLRNQGLFRVSGSQSEINRFREAYERGEDLFQYLDDGSDANSAAGVLKLYFRELREPIFPIFMFEQFCDCAKSESPTEFVRRARELVSKLPVSHVLLLRFLFAFLSHLCEFADENMMEPHNLAICFGPTLLPIPEGKDQVFYHNYVNELVRNLIIHADDVFPRDLAGPVYDKYAMQRYMDGNFIEENDLISEDDEAHEKLSLPPSRHMMIDSTYESADRILLSSPILSQANTSTPNGISPSNGAESSTHNEIDYAPIASSRSSNRSKASGSIDLAMRSEMPHRIANELNNIFKNSSLSSEGSKGISVLRHSHVEPSWTDNREHLNMRSMSTDPDEEREYVSPPPPLLSTKYVSAASCSISPAPRTIDIKERKDSRDLLYAPITRATTVPANSGSNTEMNSTGVRPIGKSSLRDQLQLMRKENSTEMKPSTSLNGSTKKLDSETTILDARSTDKSTESSRRTSLEDDKSPEPFAQPDIINSARPRGKSPTLDDILNSLKVATSISP
ncbi:Rho-GAP domain-containing protein [Caenorhabditis elegans]|uniref:Rho-GAP domain-containing protein n=1 Tax=Caenorhabditis elegans TaxID=6239 RepID=A0A061ACU6_CAEEL|nr:Rho-GAP domain-containing protein [Caenorhabditis elegans]CDR32733.1 Rho-GAP domain-containing protein [Caenorhabditis elegans]|eukprot:NP_001293964.1 Slit-Robo GAP homolog [Caenorhabditis elegans]